MCATSGHTSSGQQTNLNYAGGNFGVVGVGVVSPTAVSPSDGASDGTRHGTGTRGGAAQSAGSGAYLVLPTKSSLPSPPNRVLPTESFLPSPPDLVLLHSPDLVLPTCLPT